MKNNHKKTAATLPFPPYLSMEDDTDFGGLYSPVNAAALLDSPRSHSEILAALPKSDRAMVAKELNGGYNAVLLLDLKSGAAAIEMRKHTSPLEMPQLTPAQLEMCAARRDRSEKEIAFVAAILREKIALKEIRIVAPKAEAKKAGKK